MPAQGGDAEDRVGRTIAAIAPALDDLEEEALVIGGAVELEIFAVLVAVVEDIVCLEPLGEGRIEAEAGLQVVIVVP